MTQRFSGKGRIRVAWIDAKGCYQVSVNDGSRRVRFTVGHPPASRLAVDSPEAFDDTARAAISFACDAACMADDGQEALDSDAFAFTDSGPYVGRSPARAWPADPSDSGPEGEPGPQGGPEGEPDDTGPVGAVADFGALRACSSYATAARWGLFTAEGTADAPLFV